MLSRLPQMSHALSHAAVRAAQATRAVVLGHPRASGSIAAGVALAAGTGYTVVRLRRPSEEELERRRRARLAVIGRLTDGTVLDALTRDGEHAPFEQPDVLLYSYRIGGVRYDCAQDVTMLRERATRFRIDAPVQVRYDPRNPGNSILLSEEWSGLLP